MISRCGTQTSNSSITWKILEMQIFRIPSRPTESESLYQLSKYIYSFTYVFMHAGSFLLLRLFSSLGKQELLSLVAVQGLLTAVNSLVVEHGL